MKQFLLTLFLSVATCFSVSAQEKVMYEDTSVTITAERIECGDMVYAAFKYTNKTNETITITYDQEVLFAGQLGYQTDTEAVSTTIILNPGGTASGVCGSHNYLLFLGSKSHKIFVVDYQLTNIQIQI